MISFSLSLGQKNFIHGLADRGRRVRMVLTEKAVGLPALLGVHALARKLDHPGFHSESLDDGRHILWSHPPEHEKTKTAGRIGVHVPPIPILDLIPIVGTDETEVFLTDAGAAIVEQIREQVALQALSNTIKETPS